MNPRRDFDAIGFRRLASASRPGREVPLRCSFGCIATPCPPMAAVFGSCATVAPGTSSSSVVPVRDVLRHGPAPHPRFGGRSGCATELSRCDTPAGATRRARVGRRRWETGSPAAAKDLEEERSPGRSGSFTHRQRRGTAPDSTTEQGLEADAPGPPTTTDLQTETGTGEARRRSGRERQGGNGRGDAFRLSAGISSRGTDLHRGKAEEGHGLRPGRQKAETRWTSGSAAGCNKPATREAEETVEVVRNHAGGTGLRGWHPRSRSDDWPSSREWTTHEHVDGGATGASPGSRGWDVWTEPKREGRAIGQGDRYGSGEERR
jgi:hypothetical protein